jgi:tRNA nucleotidyltransferase (CCA-adding enzyme)
MHGQTAKPARLARDPATRCVQQIGRRLKLSNDEIDATAWLVRQQDVFLDAASKPWSEVQPLLIMPWAASLLHWSEVRAQIRRLPSASLVWCRERLSWPPAQLDPSPILTGDDLIRGGIQPGPLFTGLLTQLRAKQLDGQFASKEAAWEWLRSL